MKTLKKPAPFDVFCEKYIDGIYDPRHPKDKQSTGYYKLKEMVLLGIEPASEEEYNRWKYNPTKEEMFSEPDIKYLTFLHETVRPYIREYWWYIKKLRTE